MSMEEKDSPQEDTSGEGTPSAVSLTKPAIGAETFIFLGSGALILGFIGSRMGAVNMVNTLLNTAYDLLMNTSFYLMAVAVMAGALAALLSEFGVIALLNRILSPLMQPLYGLPGASAVSVLTCYISDNPAILTLCDDMGFRKYFRKYQLPALTNVGTAFGMGMIVTVFMVGLSRPGESYLLPVFIGNVGAIVGSVISARLFLPKSRRLLGTDYIVSPSDARSGSDPFRFRAVRPGNAAERILNATLDGGNAGVKVGMSIITPTLVICTLIMMLSKGPGAAGYTGAAYEGIALFPAIGEKLSFILTPLFGFSDPSCVAVPITAMGAAGGAIGLVPNMVAEGIVHGNDIAVFTAMCMCWSGFLGTHVAMMNSLNCRSLTGHAILCHTVGGLGAGVVANLLYRFCSVLL